MCLRDKIQEAEEKIAFLEYMISMNDGPEATDFLDQLKEATYTAYELNAELLERQLEGTV